MQTSTLTDLMMIKLGSAEITEFNPDGCIEAWLNGAKRSRRPGFMDNKDRMYKRARLDNPEYNSDSDTESVLRPTGEDSEQNISETHLDETSMDNTESDSENELDEEEVLQRLQKLD